MKRLFGRIKDLFLKPSVRIGLGVLVTGGFIAGAGSWQGFNTAMEATNKEEFCIGCHTMHDNLLPELQKTVHWNNRSGVRARCPDRGGPGWLDRRTGLLSGAVPVEVG